MSVTNMTDDALTAQRVKVFVEMQRLQNNLYDIESMAGWTGQFSAAAREAFDRIELELLAAEQLLAEIDDELLAREKGKLSG